MLPRCTSFMAAHRLTDVTVVADAGMVSESQPQSDRERRGCRFILGARIPDIPYVISEWRHKHPDTEPRISWSSRNPGRPVLPTAAGARSSITSTAPTGPGARCAVSTNRSARPRRRSPGKCRSNATGSSSSTGADKSVNRDLETKVRAWPGGRATSPTSTNPTPEFVISAYHQLWHVEKSFRMSKHDLRARPIYHHKRESIEAHLAVVFAALAVIIRSRPRPAGQSRSSSAPPAATRTVDIRAGQHILTAEDPMSRAAGLT